MTIASLDFAQLYRQHLAQAGRPAKQAADWDARAAGMSTQVLGGPYVDQFIGHMNLAGVRTLLDVGCGPGTIGLSLAHRLQQVIGLDFSAHMLALMRAHAAERGLSNVETLQLAWEDDWQTVPVCDVVVASRSMLVADMAEALRKLHHQARLRVYLTSLVGGCFVDPVIMEVLGRPLQPLPDYIYILNILYGMGIHARLDYIEHAGRLSACADFGELVQRITATLGALDAAELERLHAWYHHTPIPPLEQLAPMRWALVSWDVHTQWRLS